MIARLRDPRLLAALVGLAVLFVAAAMVPHPSIDQVRTWSESVGPMFVVAFFIVHVVVTMAPIPRTIFTVSAGVLFGAATGIAVALAATTVSAVLALLVVRAIGRDAVAAHLTHPAVKAVDARLARRGWLAVGSLRLIAAIPFSVVNYCCGVSSIRVLPYTVATVVGTVPGTVGVVLLADALTGKTDPAMLAVSGVCIAVGVLGLFVDARTPVPEAAVKD
ncbi:MULTISPECIES: TVP38/TMEM64 family protein [unclassified Rhodococcus (in: high G+C Gram-positive bacteria)]|uniref:TVP38/TMEM64 family protein n=1 Tax=unclassified Rhodococcus (in: high G+C Gram-positive bacteria) TaxID=192944 RepID=UPI000E2BF7A4|nr:MULTISPECIES: TVP38/TMEM64 family protein [unclassified Rhodococcus (in: high G+C Gram-positive bacteria)]QKT11491.1 TVP38/TMEM64 family protein [Rhodococcus sp. W8901]RDI19912.1 putative membrane protein YdjX (TVP38/TMEM64 family) [Rhodococcus sp. AG1013]